jgi:hypothetical protein
LKKTAKGNTSGGRDATAAALKILRSPDSFAQHQGALRGLGLAGWEVPLGLGMRFATASRFQSYPMRVQLLEETEGTTEYITKSIAPLIPPGDLLVMSPTDEKVWAQFAQSPNDKILYIPRMAMVTDAGMIEFDVQDDRIVRRTPERNNGRVVNETEEVKGRFVCISSDRPDWNLRCSRWLTMVQRDGKAATQSWAPPPDPDVWHEVDRLLKVRAQRRIWLPEWEQIVVEQMCQRDDRALRHLPALMQMWRTMCLIRSFQKAEIGTGKSLVASFEDLAEAILLAKKVFREGAWFPPVKTVFDGLPARYVRTGVISPVTGKALLYERHEEPTRWQSVLP